jgi:hypothetical protein
MIPRVGREGETLPATRATRAQVARTGTRTAGVGERNIHRADCTDVRINVHTGGTPVNMIGHTSLNTHTGTRNRTPARTAQPHRDCPNTPYGYHTPDNTPSFFLLPSQKPRNRE